MAIPLATLFWMSGSVCDWEDWHPNHGPIDVNSIRNVKNALFDGLGVLVADAEQYASLTAGPAIGRKTVRGSRICDFLYVRKCFCRYTIASYKPWAGHFRTCGLLLAAEY